MKQIKFLLTALVAVAAMTACKHTPTPIPLTYNQLIVGKWTISSAPEDAEYTADNVEYIEFASNGYFNVYVSVPETPAEDDKDESGSTGGNNAETIADDATEDTTGDGTTDGDTTEDGTTDGDTTGGDTTGDADADIKYVTVRHTGKFSCTADKIFITLVGDTEFSKTFDIVIFGYEMTIGKTVFHKHSQPDTTLSTAITGQWKLVNWMDRTDMPEIYLEFVESTYNAVTGKASGKFDIYQRYLTTTFEHLYGTYDYEYSFLTGVYSDGYIFSNDYYISFNENGEMIMRCLYDDTDFSVYQKSVIPMDLINLSKPNVDTKTRGAAEKVVPFL